MDFSPQQESEIWRRVLSAPPEGAAAVEAAEAPAPSPTMPEPQPKAEAPKPIAEAPKPIAEAPKPIADAVTPETVRDCADREWSAAWLCRAMASRFRGAAQQLFRSLTADHQQHARRLCAVLFLMTGEKVRLPRYAVPDIPGHAEALRDRYIAERQSARDYEKLAASGSEFSQTFSGLADRQRQHAGQLLELIEQSI